MRNLVVLFIHFIATLARLLGPGGVRSLVAESLLLKHQLLIVNRSRHRSPNLSASDRILAGLMVLCLPKMLSGANASKISDLQEAQMGQPSLSEGQQQKGLNSLPQLSDPTMGDPTNFGAEGES